MGDPVQEACPAISRQFQLKRPRKTVRNNKEALASTGLLEPLRGSFGNADVSRLFRQGRGDETLQLTALGIRCEIATSGKMALERIKERDFDPIICDVRLPDIDGPALYGWIAEHRPALRTRVAFVTGDTLGHASERFLADVRRPLLEKPFLPADVRRLVDELLSV
jgi:CheY-like chemotaxis protein